MKSKINLIKSSALLILALSIIILTSCGGQNEKSSNQKGTYDGTNSCELINTDDIRSVFNLSNTVEVDRLKSMVKYVIINGGLSKIIWITLSDLLSLVGIKKAMKR